MEAKLAAITAEINSLKNTFENEETLKIINDNFQCLDRDELEHSSCIDALLELIYRKRKSELTLIKKIINRSFNDQIQVLIDTYGKWNLFRCAYEKDAENICNYLFNDISFIEKYGNSLLPYFSQNHDFEMIKKLVENTMCKIDHDFNYALREAINAKYYEYKISETTRTQYEQIEKYLIQNGANPQIEQDIKDAKQKRAIEAKDGMYVLKYLLQNGANLQIDQNTMDKMKKVIEIN
jgi:hypothetical protein